jgi:hypothetical protein
MFAIFKNDSLLNFWANQVGDVFIDATCRGLNLDRSNVDLNFYYGIDSIPAFYEFDQDKKLIIKKEVVTINEVVTQNELGDDVIAQEEIKTYELDKIIEPVVYFAKGLMVKPC